MRKAKRIVKITIVIILLIFIYSEPIKGEVTFAGGTGEPNDPYKISTPEQLNFIGSDPNLLDKNFVLTNDIDLSGITWTPSSVRAFNGTLDGNDCTVSNLTVYGEAKRGLFGILGTSADVRNLKIVDANIVGTNHSEYIGSLAGINQGSIVNCCVEVCVTGYDCIGGLVGYNNESGTITNSHVTGTVSGILCSGGLTGDNGGIITNCSASCNEVTSEVLLGGFVGRNVGDIKCCYSNGQVTGGVSCDCIGGFVGFNTGVISDSYAIADVNNSNFTFCLGGLAGYNTGTIMNCFAAGTILNAYVEDTIEGGLVGGSFGTTPNTVINCFWDTQTSGIYTSKGGTGLTSAQMMNAEVYSLNGWAGNPNWVLDSGSDYPHLAWEYKPGQIIPEPVIDWLDGSGTQEDPFIIATADQFARIGTAGILWDKVFVLDSDLDLSDFDFPRIGVCNGTAFTGTFNGGNHTISNLTMDKDNMSAFSLGMFGYIGTSGTVHNLNLQNITVKGGWLAENVGMLAGFNQGTVADCSVNGNVSCWTSGMDIGGLAGNNSGSIVRSCSTGNVSGESYNRELGGLVGHNSGSINNCFSKADVFAGSESLGGLVGANCYGGEISDCYAGGSISGGQYVGGLVGLNSYDSEVFNCYATGSVTGGSYLGGLIGSGWDWVNSLANCYLLAESDGGGPDNGIGFSLTDEQMKQRASFADWDFDNIWKICEGKDYPHLQWENIQCEE